MKNEPKKIYLNLGEGVAASDVFTELSGITWCVDRINPTDLEFINKKEVAGIFRWLLGEQGNFPVPKMSEGQFYWRRHLRKRLKDLKIEIG